ncbi:hypothetical protein NQU36_27835, partial [Escherichia coli]|uniref:hypothetical protein n=1 Tax=Escherichia coli TaxID=562 RepID=UPI00211978F4
GGGGGFGVRLMLTRVTQRHLRKNMMNQKIRTYHPLKGKQKHQQDNKKNKSAFKTQNHYKTRSKQIIQNRITQKHK